MTHAQLNAFFQGYMEKSAEEPETSSDFGKYVTGGVAGGLGVKYGPQTAGYIGGGLKDIGSYAAQKGKALYDGAKAGLVNGVKAIGSDLTGGGHFQDMQRNVSQVQRVRNYRADQLANIAKKYPSSIMSRFGTTLNRGLTSVASRAGFVPGEALSKSLANASEVDRLRKASQALYQSKTPLFRGVSRGLARNAATAAAKGLGSVAKGATVAATPILATYGAATEAFRDPSGKWNTNVGSNLAANADKTLATSSNNRLSQNLLTGALDAINPAALAKNTNAVASGLGEQSAGGPVQANTENLSKSISNDQVEKLKQMRINMLRRGMSPDRVQQAIAGAMQNMGMA